ncbi:MAG TPA: peptidoglycan-binding protein [Verrucomicrobiales bacterium]|nr:peptidoglycan-binding protein [Verrucomicrobiales bacterium]
MTLFDRAVNVVLANEGSTFTDHPSDRGGPTKYGISQVFHPDIDVKNLTREQAKTIYKVRYWQGRRYDELPDWVAIKTFDLAVNMGDRNAAKILQRALRAVGYDLKDDGIIGNITIGAAKQADEFATVVAMRSEAAGYYRSLAERKTDQAVFLRGWLNRAYA